MPVRIGAHDPPRQVRSYRRGPNAPIRRGNAVPRPGSCRRNCAERLCHSTNVGIRPWAASGPARSVRAPETEGRRHGCATTRSVRVWLAGTGPATHLPQRPAPCAVPVHVAAVGRVAVELAGEIADGAMPTFWSPQRVAQSKEWLSDGRSRSVGLGPFELTLGISTFLGDDLATCRAAARQNLALYTGLPFFQRMWRDSGFVEETTRMVAGAGGASFSDAMLDAFCLIGPVSRCRERLAEYRDCGVDLPILGPPVTPGAARETIAAFAA
ncbi:LLM class flavin-dependent oxidoreductase [Pseudonocardia sp.]